MSDINDASEEVAQPVAPGLAALQFQGPYQALYQQMQQQAQQKQKAQQEYLASLQKQEAALGQQGMSDYDRASMLFQAAGALGQPTRSGGFGETLGNVATSLSGPLSKAAEAQRMRAQQLQQLQMARQKLGMEMAGTGGVDPGQALQLLKAQQDQEEEKPTPSEFERVIGQLSPEERAKAIRVKAGLEASAERPKQKDISDTTLSTFSKVGTAIYNLDDLQDRFKDDFAGKLSNQIAEAQNVAGTKGILPGYQDQGAWWGDYAERRNQLRKELFGSAVTSTEKPEFEKADIMPGMDPAVVKQKLARQREVVRQAAYKLAKAKLAQGYDISPIEEAIGYKLTDLEKSVKPEKKGAASSGPSLEDIDAELARRNK